MRHHDNKQIEVTNCNLYIFIYLFFLVYLFISLTAISRLSQFFSLRWYTLNFVCKTNGKPLRPSVSSDIWPTNALAILREVVFKRRCNAQSATGALFPVYGQQLFIWIVEVKKGYKNPACTESGLNLKLMSKTKGCSMWGNWCLRIGVGVDEVLVLNKDDQCFPMMFIIFIYLLVM